MAGKEVSVNFSGGVDSTTTVLLLLEEYDRVHLHTYNNGYGHWFVNLSKIHVKDLVEHFGEERIVHRTQSSKALFEKLVLNTLAADYRKYKSGFVWCMGCQIAFHMLTIIYNLENEVAFACDGSSPEVDFAVMQMPVSLQETKHFYAEYGILFTTPIYRVGGREEEKRRLQEMGMFTGIPFFKRNPGTQPFCVPGNIQHFFDTFFNLHPRYDPEQVRRFCRDKQLIAKEYINEYFRNKKQDIRDLVKNIQAIRETNS